MDDRSQGLLAGYPDHHPAGAMPAESSAAESSAAESSAAAAGFWLTKKGGTLLGKSQRRWFQLVDTEFRYFETELDGVGVAQKGAIEVRGSGNFDILAPGI